MAELRHFTAAEVPELLDLPGVGPVVAGMILLAWSHPGRVCSEAAFAALAGISPIPPHPSGNTIYRLNQGGDRQLNRVLTTTVLVRMTGPSNPSLPGQTPSRRPNNQGDHAHPPAPHRPPNLPDPHHRAPNPSITSLTGTLAAGCRAQRGFSVGVADVRLRYVFGIQHISRPEDWAAMPADTVAFWLRPSGFFDRNRALDLSQ